MILCTIKNGNLQNKPILMRSISKPTKVVKQKEGERKREGVATKMGIWHDLRVRVKREEEELVLFLEHHNRKD